MGQPGLSAIARRPRRARLLVFVEPGAVLPILGGGGFDVAQVQRT